LWGGLASGEATRLMVSSMANHPDDTNAQTVSGQATESEATITHTRMLGPTHPNAPFFINFLSRRRMASRDRTFKRSVGMRPWHP
ncbi:hypothetical protein FRB93_013547, partial [Tulasnella sp. JGI-2019a]